MPTFHQRLEGGILGLLVGSAKNSFDAVNTLVVQAGAKIMLAERTLGENSRSIESPRCRYLWLEDQPPDWSVHISQALSPLAARIAKAEQLTAHASAAEFRVAPPSPPAPPPRGEGRIPTLPKGEGQG